MCADFGFMTGSVVDGQTDRYSALPALTSNFGWHTCSARRGYGEMVS